MKSGYLLDTNVVSEPTHHRPDRRVELWLGAQATRRLFLSAITIGELRKGIELLDQGKRRLSLEYWLEVDLLQKAPSRIVPVTQSIADRWGMLTAQRQRAGNPLGFADGLIAATVLEHNLVLVTRNTKHFLELNLPLLNPWDTKPRVM